MAIAIASVSVEALASVAIARDSHAGGAQLPSPASQSPQVLTLASADAVVGCVPMDNVRDGVENRMRSHRKRYEKVTA